MANDAYVPRTSKDEDASHKLDAERTAWESGRDHDSGTGSPQATSGESSSKSSSKSSRKSNDAPTGDEPTGDEPTGTK